MASQLMALRFPADESLQAATQCSSLYAAVSFLHQECELCAGRCSAKEVSRWDRRGGWTLCRQGGGISVADVANEVKFSVSDGHCAVSF